MTRLSYEKQPLSGFPVPVCVQLPHIGEAEAKIISSGSHPVSGIREYIKLPREQRKVGGRLWLLFVCVHVRCIPWCCCDNRGGKVGATLYARVCVFFCCSSGYRTIENLERATLFACLRVVCCLAPSCRIQTCKTKLEEKRKEIKRVHVYLAFR